MAELPDDVFDVVVVGTDLVGALVAAAAARIGKRVLHLDSANHYGGSWASLSLCELAELAEHGELKAEPMSDLPSGDGDQQPLQPGESETFVELQPEQPLCHNAKATIYQAPAVKGCFTTSCRGVQCYSASCRRRHGLLPSFVQACKRSRHFSLDLASKLCLSRGDLVQLLISSNVGRYLEFKPATGTFMLDNGTYRQVPSSKQALFSDKSFSLKDKAMLTKFLKFVQAYNPDDAPAEELQQPFLSVLESKWGLKGRLKTFVAFGMTSSAFTSGIANVSAEEGLRAIKKYLGSLGHYGATPYICSMYGSGEVVQAYCRLCAVFGGVYMLRTKAEQLVVDADQKCVGVVAGGMRYTCSSVVLPSTLVSGQSAYNSTSWVSRAVVVTDRPLAGAAEDLTIINVPADQEQHAHSSGTLVACGGKTMGIAADGYCVTSWTTLSPRDQAADDALEPLVSDLVSLDGSASDKPRAVWSCFFNTALDDDADTTVATELKRVYPSRALPDGTAGFAAAIREAKRIFEQLAPGEEFLPSAPNPEDIVWDAPVEEEAATGAEGGDADLVAAGPVTTVFDTEYVSLAAYQRADNGDLFLPADDAIPGSATDDRSIVPDPVSDPVSDPTSASNVASSEPAGEKTEKPAAKPSSPSSTGGLDRPAAVTQTASSADLHGPTEQSYFHDTFQFTMDDVPVLSVASQDDGRTIVTLPRTIFHPQGGGQPADVGQMVCGDSVFVVQHVQRERESGIIEHIGDFEGDKRFSAGDQVVLHVDEKARRLHARLHSAGHLLDAAMKNLGRTDLKPGKGYHFPDGGAYVEYVGAVAADDREGLMQQLNEELKRLIAADSDVSVVNPSSAEDMRQVDIGGVGCPCGGTHVKQLSDIEGVTVTRIKKNKKNVKVSYTIAGFDA